MKLRTACVACILVALPWAAVSQTAEGAAQAAPSPAAQPAPGAAPTAVIGQTQAPDAKAYSDANRTTGPAEKIGALEKFKHDFPTSTSVDSANQAILSTLVSKMPTQTDRIKTQAALTFKASAKGTEGQAAGQIASTLLGGNLLLKVARGYARKSIAAMVEEQYIKDQIAAAEKRKQTPPASEELSRRFRQSRASRVAVLGRIEAALGHDAAARPLLEEARKELPTNSAVTGVLGELAAKRGDDATALELLVSARLNGRTADSTTSALEAVYKKSHGGSAAGLADYLNSEYRKRFPNPLNLEPYKATEKRTDRIVLAEIFTGAGCPPCVSVDLAFDAAMRRYGPENLAVLMYHMHIPRPDPISNLDAQTRAKFYSVNAVPTFAVDGKVSIGGGSRENTQETYSGRRGFKTDIEKDLESPTQAFLSLTAALRNGTVDLTATVDGVKTDSEEVQLQIALVEKELTYSGENGIRFHPMVVRAMAGQDAKGYTNPAGEAFTVETQFDIAKVSAAAKAHLDDYEAKGHRGEPFKFAAKMDKIDAGNLAVVAFVQDPKTKRVLQAAVVNLSQPQTKLLTEE